MIQYYAQEVKKMGSMVTENGVGKSEVKLKNCAKLWQIKSIEQTKGLISNQKIKNGNENGNRCVQNKQNEIVSYRNK